MVEPREADLVEPREADLAEQREADPGGSPGGADRTLAAPERSPGWLRAMVVVGVAVDVVLIAAAVTFLLPAAVGDVVFRTPLLILILIGGTSAVLWTMTHPGRIDR
ncbi:MAG TPA: hypothetical protein VFJ71_08425 [Candidatus Limnocylindrales bacterium]|nr:hypothetical protein [Candidatus Limnocylindrales bacterium]